MHLAATAGLGFLLAVLWFDLMFDVQVRSYPDAIPESVVDSIAAYYRRVTTNARPMNGLIALVMLITLGSLVGEIVRDDARPAAAWAALVLTAIGVGLAAARTVRDARRLGAQLDEAPVQQAIARSIYRDHVVCLFVILGAVVVQVGFA